MNKVIMISLLLLSFSGLLEARALEEIKNSGFLIVAVDGVSPPFNYYKDNELVGFEIDLIKKMAANLSLKIQWVVQPFNTLLTALDQDRFDVIAASHTITPERLQVVEFIEPHYCNDAVIVSKPEGPSTVAGLSGKIVSVALGTVYYEKLKKLDTIKEIRTMPGEVDGLQALLSGRSDAWVTEKPIAIGALKASHQEGKLKIGEAIMQQVNAMSVAKGNTALHLALNQELQLLMMDGTYDSLRKNYLEDDIRCQQK